MKLQAASGEHGNRYQLRGKRNKSKASGQRTHRSRWLSVGNEGGEVTAESRKPGRQ